MSSWPTPKPLQQRWLKTPGTMRVVTVKLPLELQRVIDDGRWVTRRSVFDERVPPATARQWDPQALGIHLEQQPSLLSKGIARAPELENLWNLTDVDTTRCLVVADFRIGSDK